MSMLGKAPWSSAPGRRSDGTAAAMLAVAWMGLFDEREAAVLKTLDHVRQNHWHGDGVLLQGGAHPALTALLVVVEERARPDTAPDPIDVLATLASSTGAIPTALHPHAGHCSRVTICSVHRCSRSWPSTESVPTERA